MVQQKVGIDLRGGKADFQLNYVQDKPIGAPFADFFANLLEYTGDDTLPQDPDGYGHEVWFENYLDACGTMYTRERLIAFPYDSAVACTFYRQDLFEQHEQRFREGIWLPDGVHAGTTWKQLYEFAAFFKKPRAAGQDVPYGYAQHQGSFAWTTQLDIQRLMFSHGRWTEFDIDDKLGSQTPGPTNWGDEQSVLLMQKFKDLADVSHPDNLANGTLQLNTVYQAGQIAMQVQYNEFAASIEDEKTSRAAGGKTAYVPCPKGEKSWLVKGGGSWSTAPIAASAASASTATRRTTSSAPPTSSRSGPPPRTRSSTCCRASAARRPASRSWTIPEVAGARNRPTTMPNALTFAAVYDFGIKDPNFVLGPEDPGGQRVSPDHPGPRAEMHLGQGRRPKRPARRSSRRPTI